MTERADSERLAQTLADALCDDGLELDSGDVLLVTASDGVRRDTLEGAGVDAILEHALGSSSRGPQKRDA